MPKVEFGLICLSRFVLHALGYNTGSLAAIQHLFFVLFF